MSTKASSEESTTSIEYARRFLPPLWVDIQEEIERHIEEITHKMSELKRLQQKRLKVNFVSDDDDESSLSLQRAIDGCTVDITQLVRASEGKLKELMKYQSDDKYDEQSTYKCGCFDIINNIVRKNISIQLA